MVETFRRRDKERFSGHVRERRAQYFLPVHPEVLHHRHLIEHEEKELLAAERFDRLPPAQDDQRELIRVALGSHDFQFEAAFVGGDDEWRELRFQHFPGNVTGLVDT